MMFLADGLMWGDRKAQMFCGFLSECVSLDYLINTATHPNDMDRVRAEFEHAKDPKVRLFEIQQCRAALSLLFPCFL